MFLFAISARRTVGQADNVVTDVCVDALDIIRDVLQSVDVERDTACGYTCFPS